MGRWLDALKTREDAQNTPCQNRQNPVWDSSVSFGGAVAEGLSKKADLEKILKTAPDGTAKTDNTAQTPVLSVLSVLSGSETENNSGDQRRATEGEKREEPFSDGRPMRANERRIIPFPGQDWKPDTINRTDDLERYADALRLHSPASYGKMMRVLGWGGTRAGRAEDALLKQGRIAFDNRGFAVLIDQQGQTDE